MLLELIHSREDSTDVLYMISEMDDTTEVQSVRLNQDGKSITTRLWVSKKTILDIEPEFLAHYTLGLDKIYVLEL